MREHSDDRSPPRPASAVRLVLLVLEGYAYIAVVVAALIGAPALLVLGLYSRKPFVALIAMLVGVPLLVAVRSAVRALLFRLPPPDGVRVTAADAPLLHAEVERLRQAVAAPQVSEIVVIGDFNASVVQLPRFGVFWPRNYLLIGLPLFATLAPDQMRAVIAHELAHLSRAHGRLSLLVHRLRLSWARLLGALGPATPTFALLLFRWYAPRLQAHSTALARSHEFVVDRLAARVAGVVVAAETIVALGVLGPLYEDAMWTVTRDEDERPGPFSRTPPDVWTLVATDGQQRLETMLSRTTGSWDTHPALGERLEAIGGTPSIPAQPERLAAEVFLGAQMVTIAARLDEQWAVAQGAEWRARRDERRRSRETLALLDRVAAPTPSQLYEKAELVDSLEGPEAAFPLYERAMEAGHAGAALAIGYVLLERSDDRGVALIERAIAANESLGAEGNRRIARFLESRGRMVDANRYLTLAKAAATRQSLAATERREVSAVDRFAAHGLDQAAVARIVAVLTRTREVDAAFLVSRELRHSVGKQLVLAIDADGAPPSLADGLRAAEILSEAGCVVLIQRRDMALRQALGDVPGARVYRRV